MAEQTEKKGIGAAILGLVRNKNFLLMMLISLCNNMSLNLAKTPLSLYGKSFGMQPWELGAITGTYYLICTIIRPFSGALIDKFNKKLVMSCCFGIKMIAWIIFATCQNPTMFTIARYIDAVAFCLITTCFLTTASTLVDKKAMGTGIAIYSGLPTVITTVIPPIATYLYTNMGGRIHYYIGLVIMAIGIVLIQLLDFSKAVGTGRRGPGKFSFSNFIYLPAVPVCLITFFMKMMLTVNDTYLLLMAQERGIAGAAFFFSLMTGLKFVSALGFGVGSDMFGVKWLLVGACAMAAGAAVLLGASTTTWMIILAGVLYSVASNGSDPILSKAATMVAPPEKRGAAISTNYFIFDLAGVFAGYIAGFLFNKYGYANGYYMTALFPIIGMVILLATYKKFFGKYDNQDAAPKAEA